MKELVLADFITTETAAAVLVAKNVTDISGYSVDAGTLFTIGTDLYITNAAPDGVLSGNSSIAVTANGTKLPVYASVDAAIAAGKKVLITSNFTNSTRFVNGAGSTVTFIGAGSPTVITGITSSEDGGAVRNIGDATTGRAVVTFSGVTFSKNQGRRGGAIASMSQSDVYVYDVTFSENSTTMGAGMYASGGTMDIDNCKFLNNTGAGIYCNGDNAAVRNSYFEGNGGAYGAVGSNRGVIVTNCIFRKNSAPSGTSGIIYSSSTKNSVVTVQDSQFYDNEGCAIYQTASPGVVTVSDTVFSGNDGAFNIVSAAAVTITDCEFLTSTDTITCAGTVTFGGDIVLKASLLGSGQYSAAAGTVIELGAGVDLKNSDLSNAVLTFDGKDYADGTVVATNVGNFSSAKALSPYQYLKLENSTLMIKNLDAAISAGDVFDTFSGNGVTIMDGGEVSGAFFAQKTDEADVIATKVTGGKVESNFIGGAYAVGSAEIGKVELEIAGDADIAARVYSGGYLYGNAGDAGAAAEAQMTVDQVNINIDGGAVSTNMFGGAHARQNGNASVTEVNITVTNGSHGRIYAGGWAEKGAVSSVGISNVIISGGTVDYLYGAGANADGETYVTTTNITVSDAAVVNTIFMGGRYGYSYVDTVNLTFAGENKELTRLSGVSSAGMDYADATNVELKTNVTADLIDYVDKFVINEDCTLTANNEFYLGNRIEGGADPGVTTFDFIADGEANWTAVAGISDFTNAKFSVNGAGLTTWDGAAAIEIGGYSLTYDADKKTITLANA